MVAPSIFIAPGLPAGPRRNGLEILAPARSMSPPTFARGTRTSPSERESRREMLPPTFMPSAFSATPDPGSWENPLWNVPRLQSRSPRICALDNRTSPSEWKPLLRKTPAPKVAPSAPSALPLRAELMNVPPPQSRSAPSRARCSRTCWSVRKPLRRVTPPFTSAPSALIARTHEPSKARNWT